MHRHLTFLISLMCATSSLITTGCRHKDEEIERKLGFDAFVPVYNRYIETWLKTQQMDTDQEIIRVTG